MDFIEHCLELFSANKNNSNKTNPSHSWGQKIQKYGIQEVVHFPSI